jgi:hypothetical protein
MKIQRRSTNYNIDIDNELRITDFDSASECNPVRLRSLAQQIHSIGPRPLFELLTELAAGAPPIEGIERYGRLAHEYGAFIRAFGGDQFPSGIFLVSEIDQ